MHNKQTPSYLSRFKFSSLSLKVISLGAIGALAASVYMAASHAQGIKYDLAYPRSGDDRAKPSQVFDDGRITYIQMRRGQAPFMVFAITPSGQKKLNTKQVDNCNGDCVAVDGIYEELMFTSEGAKAIVRYAGQRQNMAAGVQNYGAASQPTSYGAIGSIGGAPALQGQGTQALAALPAAVIARGAEQRFPPVDASNNAPRLVVPPDLTQLPPAQAQLSPAPRPQGSVWLPGAPQNASQAAPLSSALSPGLSTAPSAGAATGPVSPMPASQAMVLTSNGQGRASFALTSVTGGFLPTLDGTLINPPIKPGYQPEGTWVKGIDIDALRSEINNAGANGRYAADYNYAKAACLVDLTADIHRQRRNNGVTEWLLHSAKAHSNAAMANQLVSYRTPQLPGEQYVRQNQELWRDLTAVHQLQGARCDRAPVLLACASVQLLGAEFKRGENYPEDAIPYVNAARTMIQQASAIANACPPIAAPSAPAMTIAAAPQAAPPVQLSYTKDTLANQSLFGFDNSTLSNGAITALNEFVAKVKRLFMSISLLDVVGFTDRLGGKAHNQKLSEKRAEAVKTHLVKELDQAGLRPTIINARGEGANKPITTAAQCKGDRETKVLVDCLAPDRRVEINLTGDLRGVAPIAHAAPIQALVPVARELSPIDRMPALAMAQASNPVPASATALTPEQQLAQLDAQRQALANQIQQQKAQALATEQQAMRKVQQDKASQAALIEAQEAGKRAYAAAMAKAGFAVPGMVPGTATENTIQGVRP